MMALIGLVVATLGTPRPASAFTSEPPDDGWATFTIKAPAQWTVHESLVPESNGFWSKVHREGWITPGPVSPNFKIVLGTLNGSKNYDDPNHVTHSAADGYALPSAATGTDGFVYQVRAGYGVVSGTAPILAGKRVRAASDGTQFAIDISVATDNSANPPVQVYTERVYFLSTYKSEAVRVKIYKNDKQDTAPVASHDMINPGDFCEVVWSDVPDSEAAYNPFNISTIPA
ncbi:MAG TPA: hypothetical protein VHC70_13360, partial [Phycisphaerales bacterium]|nr:hypothetical protein [Phycisphaerales bacterium]